MITSASARKPATIHPHGVSSESLGEAATVTFVDVVAEPVSVAVLEPVTVVDWTGAGAVVDFVSVVIVGPVRVVVVEVPAGAPPADVPVPVWTGAACVAVPVSVPVPAPAVAMTTRTPVRAAR